MSTTVLRAWIGGESWDKCPDDKPSAIQDLVSPWTGAPSLRIHAAGQVGVAAAVEQAVEAVSSYRRWPLHERVALLERAAAALEVRIDAVVAACISDIGKPRRAATIEARRTVAFMRAVAAQACDLGGKMVPLDASAAGVGRLGFTQRIPYGVIGAVTPFNAPANLLMQKAAPALVTGNAIVVKPSPEGTRVALIVAECFKEAGLPDGLYSVVPGGAEEALALASHPGVSLVTVTGSTAAGEALARAAGAKKFIGELGGNAPNIVLQDADIDDAAVRIAASAFEASGQQCISAQRIIVEAPAYTKFLAAFVDATKTLKVGDPERAETDVGPVVHRRAAERIMRTVEEAVNVGGKLLLGGTCENCLIPPIILAEAPLTCGAVKDEIFGPVAVMLTARDAADALRIANLSEFGLQAALFTRDVDLAFEIAGGLNAGAVWINEASRFRLDNYPFGGVGRSGHGREGVRAAMEEYTQQKFTGLRLREALRQTDKKGE